MFQNMNQMWSVEEAQKMMQQAQEAMQTNMMDTSQLAETNKKTMESFTQASTVMADTWNAFFERQMQMMQTNMEENIETMRDLSTANGIEDMMAKQSTVAKQTTDKVQSNAQELSQIMQKGQQKAMDIVSKQMTQTMQKAAKAAK